MRGGDGALWGYLLGDTVVKNVQETNKYQNSMKF